MLNWDGAGPDGTNGTVYSATVNTLNVRDQVTQVRQWAGPVGSGAYQDTTMTYDGYGRLKTRHLPQQQIDPNNPASSDHSTWEYNADDTILSMTDARGASATYSYNQRHLPIGITYQAPPSVASTPNIALGYDAAGNRVWMTDSLGRIDYEYDQLSRMLAERRRFNDSLPQAPLADNSYKLQYSYNLSGNLASLTDPFGATINYAYDATRRLREVTGSNFAGVTTYATNAQYRASLDLKHLDYGNGQQMNATFDSRLRKTRFTIDGAGYQVIQREYQYHADGRMRYAKDLLNPIFDRHNEYDHLARIKEARSGAEARGLTEPNHQNLPYRQSYSYDAFGNVTSRMGTQWVVDSNVSQTFTNHRQDHETLDADGRHLYAVISGFEDNWVITDHYKYDAAGRMAMTEQSGDPPPDEISDPPERLLQRLDSGRDGDGFEVKQAVTNFSEEGQLAALTSKYYIRSTVLGGQVITEAWSDGRKTRTFVHAGGTVLAWQVMRVVALSPDVPEVWWEYRDPGATTAQVRDQAGAWDSWKVSYAGVSMTRAELDPSGADVGWNYASVLPPPSPPATGNFGGGFGWPDPEEDPVFPDGRRVTCIVDGHRTPCANAWNVLRGWGVKSIEITGPFSGYLSSQLAITESTRLVGRTPSAHVKSRVRALDGPEGTGDWDPAEVDPGDPGYLETTYEATVLGFWNFGESLPQDSRTVCERMAADAQRIADEIRTNLQNVYNRVSPAASLLMFNKDFGLLTFGSWFEPSITPLGAWGTWASGRDDVLGHRDYQGDSGFAERFKDTLNPGQDQVHHAGAFISAGITGHKFAATDHRNADANEGNLGDVALSDQSFALGAYLRKNPAQLKNVGNLLRKTICQGEGVPD